MKGALAAGVLTVGLSGIVGGRAATLTSNILEGRDALYDYWNPVSIGRDAAFAIGGTWLFGNAANAITGRGRNYFTDFFQSPQFSGATSKYGGREFDPEQAGGPVRQLRYEQVNVTEEGVNIVERHLNRFVESGKTMELAEAGMLARLRGVVNGDIVPTPQDLAFYTHELREFVHFRRLGWEAGLPSGDAAYDLWNITHATTLADYGVVVKRGDPKFVTINVNQQKHPIFLIFRSKKSCGVIFHAPGLKPPP